MQRRLVVDGALGIGTSAPDVKLHVAGGVDVSAAAGGFAVFGSTSSLNLAIDNNQILVRNPATTSGFDAFT